MVGGVALAGNLCVDVAVVICVALAVDGDVGVLLVDADAVGEDVLGTIVGVAGAGATVD
jgi:hypothetical protein